jgi:lipopolysaccharide transport system ATP-binding protein
MPNLRKKMDDDVLIKAEHVSKKFCRSLKRSLWYGTQDVANALMPWKEAASAKQNGNTSDHLLPPLRKDEFWAVHDVSFEVRRGECLGLIGHNGAGKSTLLKMLNSLNRPDAGRITMRGRVGALIELNAGFNPVLTGRENIYNQAAFLGITKKETDTKFDAIVDFSELEKFLDMPVQNYSSGMKVRLGFAVASQMEPDILIIDEVLAVGDVGFRFKCINTMADLMNRAAVIFVSHTMPQVVRVCNAVVHLENGEVTYQGTDVSGGVNAYYRKVEQQPQTIAGSSDAVLESIQLKSSTSIAGLGKTLEVNHGDSLAVELVLNVNSEIRSAAVQLLFWNMEMLPVLDVIGPDLHGFVFKNNEGGRNVINLNLDRLSLNAGSHFVSVIVSSPDLSVHYLRQDNVASIQMLTDAPSGALLIEKGNWLAE